MEYKHFGIGNQYFLVMIDTSGNVFTRDSVTFTGERSYITNEFLNEYCVAKYACDTLILDNGTDSLYISMIGKQITCLLPGGQVVKYKGRLMHKNILEISNASNTYKIHTVTQKSIEPSEWEHPISTVPILDNYKKIWFHNGAGYFSMYGGIEVDSITLVEKKHCKIIADAKANIRIVNKFEKHEKHENYSGKKTKK